MDLHSYTNVKTYVGFEISTLEAVHAINFKENYFAIRQRHGVFLYPNLISKFSLKYRNDNCPCNSGLKFGSTE